ncbi:MAG: BTAD domain-containing putative transcriptional regulator [Actinomycetota bacterium]|nr:BTAD domain-containing putative transcriptional regulator [Actinomycetota bacterium]
MGADGSGSSVRLDLLGVVTLHVDGLAIHVPGQRRRTLLAALAMSSGRVLPTEWLVDLTWPEQPPEDAVRALYNHISRLRKHLGPAGNRLTSSSAGYVLDLEIDEVDVRQARAWGDRVRTSAAAEARVLAQQALDLWRGPALEEFRSHPDLSAAAVSLDELRSRLRDDLTEAQLALGDRDAVAGAQIAFLERPLQERTALLLVRALALDGRPVEAMEAAAAFRSRLAEETGLDAGPALASLEQEVAAGQHSPVAGPRVPAIMRPTGPLVGRERDRDELRRLLGEHQAVTLTGAGGVGKTRLALEVAAEIAESENVGAVLVDLSEVQDPSRVAQAVASVLLLRTSEDVTAVDVALALGDAHLLLVLDNCEHVVRACRALVDAVVARVPGVRILSTSRIVLHSRGEYVVRLQPLPVPDEVPEMTALDRQPSVRAFVEHAQRRDRSFDLLDGDMNLLVEILRRLDGLPLAIEIAASHAVAMPLASLRDRLELDMVSSDGSSDDARQATLRATIRWSFDMLDKADQELLLAAAPFPGGVDFDTLELLVSDVAPGQDVLRLLHRLLDASLLDLDRDRSRYRLLFTVRSFLLEELQARSEVNVELRFVERMVEIAGQIGAALYGEVEAFADRRLRAELPNLRAARDRARDRGDVDTLVEITLALDRPSIWRDLRELWVWCLELAERPSIDSHVRGPEILGAAAEAARLTGDYDRAVELAKRGLALGGSPAQQARCESALAAVALYRGDFPNAVRGWLLAAREEGAVQSAYLASAALASGYGGQLEEARELLKRAVALADESGCQGNHAFALYVSGELIARENPGAAQAIYERAVTEAHSVGATFVSGVAAVALVSVRTEVGDRATAAGAFADLLKIWSDTGQAPQLWTTARNAAALLLAEGQVREAILLTTHADRAPDAATVIDEAIVEPRRIRHANTGALDAEQLRTFTQEAEAMSVNEVLASASEALQRIANERADSSDH